MLLDTTTNEDRNQRVNLPASLQQHGDDVLEPKPTCQLLELLRRIGTWVDVGM